MTDGPVSGRPCVSVIILNFNNGPDTVALLETLRPHLEANGRLSAVVVDNASTDDSGSELRDWCEGAVRQARLAVTYAASERNEGYGPGNNLGIAVAKRIFKPDWYWILNNDARPVVGTIDGIMSRVVTSRADLIGMRIHTIGDSPSNDIMGGGRLKRRQGRTVMTRPGARDATVEFLSGSSFLIRGTLEERIGGFVSDHFLFWEEIDYARRAVRAGAEMEVAGDLVVNHVGGATSGAHSGGKTSSAVYYSTRAAVMYFRRHESPVATLWLVAVRLGLAVLYLLGGRANDAAAVWRGVSEGAFVDLGNSS